MSLYEHTPRPHLSRHATVRHAEEQAEASFNARVAVGLTRSVGTMTTAYLFAAIGIASLVGVFTGNTLLALACGSLSSYFLQLVLLPILSVGQNVLGRKAEIQADEAYKTTMNTYHDSEEIMQHLDAQDEQILEILRRLDESAKPPLKVVPKRQKARDA